MTDQLEHLFADLRADTMTQVRPPGSLAARSTLRRRRTRRAVGAAAFLAVAGAGGVSANLPFSFGPQNDPAELAEHAATVVGADPGAAHAFSGVATTGVVATGMMVAGHYTLTLACSGRGWLTVTLRTGTQPVGGGRIECGSGDVRLETEFELVNNLPVTTELHADDDAWGQAGYAYQAALSQADKNRLADQATERLATGAQGFQFSSFLSGPFDQSVSQPLAGRYRIAFTCVGVGQAAVRIQIRRAGGETVTNDTLGVACGPPPRIEQATYEVPADGWVDTTFEPDDVAREQSAVAVRLLPAA